MEGRHLNGSSGQRLIRFDWRNNAMERTRISRFLRIALTALCLTACVLLVALWVLSYWWEDAASVGIAGRRVGVTSVKHRIIVALHLDYPPALGISERWHLGSASIAESYR